ncbi:MAG: hypothetical protein ACTSU7_11305 [Candidatus Heimdallarchaeaceae archaeon]
MKSELDKRLSKLFTSMKTRCYNPNFLRYDRYGGRGITICQEWLDDRNKFIAWAKENGYKPKLSIDRKDNNKGYSPSNCRFITQAEQMKNTCQLRSNNSTGYRGVHLNQDNRKRLNGNKPKLKKKNPYSTAVVINGKKVHIGSYATAIEAGKAYNKYVIEHHLGYTLNPIQTEKDLS